MKRCRQMRFNNVYERWIASFDLPADDVNRNFAIDCVRNAKKCIGWHLEEEDINNPNPDAEFLQNLVWHYSEYLLAEEARIDSKPAKTLSWKQMQVNRIFYHIELRPDMVAQMKLAYKSQTGIDMDLDDEGAAESDRQISQRRFWKVCSQASQVSNLRSQNSHGGSWGKSSSQTEPLQPPCRLRVGFVPASCRLRVGFVPASCRLRAGFVPAKCRLSAG